MSTERCSVYIPQNVRVLIRSAEEFIGDAEKIISITPEVAHNTAYGAILQLAKALAENDGFVTKSKNYHLKIFEYVERKYQGKIRLALIHSCDKARKRRNFSYYNKRGRISHFTAKQTIRDSKEFLKVIKEIINSENGYKN